MDPTIIAAIIGVIGTVVASIAGVMLSYWLGSKPRGELPENPTDPKKKPPNWPGEERKGVWMVRIKGAYAKRLGFPVPPDSFVHFSWDWSGRGSSYLRQYAHDGQRPRYRGPLDPAEVFHNIEGDPIVYRQNERKPVEDHG